MNSFFNMYRFLLFTCCTLILTSCTGFFETIVEVEPPDHEEKIILWMTENATSEDFYLRVSKSRGWQDTIPRTLEDDEPYKLTAAQVRVSRNGQPIEVRSIDVPIQTHTFHLPGGFDPGDVVEIHADYPGLKSVYVRTEIPYPLSFEVLEVVDTIESENNPFYGFEVDFQIKTDRPEETYGNTFLYVGDSSQIVTGTAYNSIMSVTKLDPRLTDNYNSLSFSPESFRSKSLFNVEFSRIFSNSKLEDGFRLAFFLRSIPKEAIIYTNSFNRFRTAFDNPFSSSVNVQGNVQGGLGQVYFYQLSIFVI